MSVNKKLKIKFIEKKDQDPRSIRKIGKIFSFVYVPTQRKINNFANFFF